MALFKTTLVAGWGDMDFNGHMRNTAYLDKAADTRMLYFAASGFSMAALMAARLGPVVMQDAISYHRECHLLDELEVTLSLAGLSEDGSRMMMRNEFFRQGQLAACVTSTAGWCDLNLRKLVCPPPALLAALQALARSDDYQALPNSRL